MRPRRSSFATGATVSKLTGIVLRTKTEIADGQKERARVAKEIEAVQRERASVEGSLGDLTKQLESAERDLRTLDESASKTDSKVLVIQKEIIARSLGL